MSDLVHAYRALRRSPGFTLTAILTLALGVGINTAVFSMVNAVMLRDLPYPEPGRLVSLWEESSGADPANFSSSGGVFRVSQTRRTTVSVANLIDYQERTHAFEALSAIAGAARNLTGSGTPERLAGQRVNYTFFDLLRVKPVLGRTFLPQEDMAGASAVVVLSNELWRRRFGADPGILGRSLLLDGIPYRVIGVLPPGFQSPSEFANPVRVEFYLPAAWPADVLVKHGDHDVDVIGRLRPGSSLGAAQQELDAISSDLEKQYPDSNTAMRAVVAPLREDLVRNASEPLWILLGATGLVVLIACINVANLMLVRAAGRRQEVSVRFALGSTRGRVVRRFLAEGLVLAAGGCGAGLLLGSFLMDFLVKIAPAEIPRLAGVSLDARVFALSAALAGVAGVLAGLFPAWQVSLSKPGVRPAASVPHRFRIALVVAEISLSTVLLIGAGLLLESFVKVTGIDLGFQPERVLAMNINLPDSRYDGPGRVRFFEALESRVRALPGVESAAFANRMPLRGGWGGSLLLEGLDGNIEVDRQAVSPGYFETLGIGLVLGRLLTPDDRSGQPHVVVVNQELVRRLFGNRDPLGRRVRISEKAPWMQIVGVVNDIRRGGKTAPVNPQIYMPAAQEDLYPQVALTDFAVRSLGDPRQLVRGIQAQILILDKDQPLTNVRTLQEIISASVAQRRFQTTLLAVFASVAVVLALVGIFGVLSHSISQRTVELGIRFALGAQRGQVLAMVLKQAALWVGAGLVIGVAGALALSRYLESLLFGVGRHDWRAYALSAVALTLVALIAAAIPARRAANVEPMQALRYE